MLLQALLELDHHLHRWSGRVTQVIVGRTTGAQLLEAAAINAFLRWRFKPGAVPYREIKSVRMSPPQTKEETLLKLPLTFTLEAQPFDGVLVRANDHHH